VPGEDSHFGRKLLYNIRIFCAIFEVYRQIYRQLNMAAEAIDYSLSEH